ncbi:MAG: hypothetical protein HY719_14910, partial [Planctomycetes bacterium]|nr:hypothetical protein [Planctomycetota bacterium]
MPEPLSWPTAPSATARGGARAAPRAFQDGRLWLRFLGDFAAGAAFTTAALAAPALWRNLFYSGASGRTGGGPEITDIAGLPAGTDAQALVDLADRALFLGGLTSLPPFAAAAAAEALVFIFAGLGWRPRSGGGPLGGPAGVVAALLAAGWFALWHLARGDFGHPAEAVPFTLAALAAVVAARTLSRGVPFSGAPPMIAWSVVAWGGATGARLAAAPGFDPLTLALPGGAGACAAWLLLRRPEAPRARLADTRPEGEEEAVLARPPLGAGPRPGAVVVAGVLS